MCVDVYRVKAHRKADSLSRKRGIFMYMLLQISESKNGLVSGTHVQWCCSSTLEEAAKRARATEAANSNRIEVAVVEELYDPYCFGKLYQNLKRLDL